MDTVTTISATVDNLQHVINETTPINSGDDAAISDKTYQKAIRAVLWKLDKRLIPFLTFLELLSFLSRINIGHAKIAGIEKAIYLSNMEYGLAVSIYFIGFMVFEIPSSLIMRYIGPSKFLSIIMIIWGIIMLLMAFVKNAAGLLAARFFLGAAQAGFFPGVIFYFSIWYLREQHAFRMAIFYCGVLLSGAFGGILAYGISGLENRGNLSGWQWIFILEGSPCVILGIATYFFLGDLPETVQWLTNTEKELLTNRLRQGTGLSYNGEAVFSWQQVRCAFTDWRVYMYMFIYVSNSIAAHSLAIFLPMFINKGMDYSDAQAQLMSAPPYLMACIFTVLVSFSAGRFKERGFHIVGTATVGIVGYILLITLTSYGSKALYIATCVNCVGTCAPIPLIISWFTSNIHGHTKRAVAIGFIIGFGNISGIVVGQIYRVEDAPYFMRGHVISVSFMSAILIVSLILKCNLWRENLRRNNLTAEQRSHEVNMYGQASCDAVISKQIYNIINRTEYTPIYR